MKTIIYIVLLFASSLLLTFDGSKGTGNPDKKFGALKEQYLRERNNIKLIALEFLTTHLKSHGADSSIVGSEYLKQNIEQAYNASFNRLQSGDITMQQFCEYVLPYRLENEIPDNWRTAIIARFGKSYDSLMRRNTSAFELVSFFNHILARDFHYRQLDLPPQLKNWTSIMRENAGDCFEMTHLLVYVLRTFGIPSSFDYTPCWGNTNGMAHAWNVLISNDHITPFMGLEADPGSHYSPFILIGNQDSSKTTYRKCGKVLRRIFSENKSVPVGDPVFSEERFFYDVTDKYFQTTNLVYQTQNIECPGQFYYICNYNNGKWIPVFYGQSVNHTITFEKMANEMLYLPVSDESIPIDFPILISKYGNIKKLKPDITTRRSLTINTLRSIEEDQLALIKEAKDWSSPTFIAALNDIQGGSRPANGKRYQLFYWDGSWKGLGFSKSINSRLNFINVPGNALYKIQGENSDGFERPFTIEDGRQLWW